MTSTVLDVKAAAIAVLQALFPDPVLVTYGDPGTYQPDIMVGAGDVRVTNDRPTNGSGRSYEETGELDVIFDVWAGGDEQAQQAVTTTATTMFYTFRDYFKTRPNETLGGVCREAWVPRWDLAEEATRNAGGDVTGRRTTVLAVLQFKTRN